MGHCGMQSILRMSKALGSIPSTPLSSDLKYLEGGQVEYIDIMPAVKSWFSRHKWNQEKEKNGKTQFQHPHY